MKKYLDHESAMKHWEDDCRTKKMTNKKPKHKQMNDNNNRRKK